jgi:hypothetical protein
MRILGRRNMVISNLEKEILQKDITLIPHAENLS